MASLELTYLAELMQDFPVENGAGLEETDTLIKLRYQTLLDSEELFDFLKKIPRF